MSATLDELFGRRAAVIVPAAVAAPVARALRDLLAPHLSRHALLDRGSYEVATVEPGAFAAPCELARRLAEEHTGRTLEVTEARVLQLSPGDYLLAHHDRIDDDQPVEVTLDLSPAPVPRAEIHYRRRGQVYFRVPCAPGAAAIVERGPSVSCNHTYVSRLHEGARVVRLVVRLRDRVTP